MPIEFSVMGGDEGSGYQLASKCLIDQGHRLIDAVKRNEPAETRALADFCLVLFNSNEFVFVY